MVATLKIPLERRNKRTGRMENARIWELTDRSVRTRLSEAVEAAATDGVTFTLPITPHTFRHSYAMHMLYAGMPKKVLQSLMGHKSISSTEVYTKFFAIDVAGRHRVRFAMPEDEDVKLIKKFHLGHRADILPSLKECWGDLAHKQCPDIDTVGFNSIHNVITEHLSLFPQGKKFKGQDKRKRIAQELLELLK